MRRRPWVGLPAAAGAFAALILGGCGDEGGPSGGSGPAPSIDLTSPSGGESWAVGSEQEITWQSVGVASVRIELSRDGGWTWEELAASEDASSGSFTWTVAGGSSPVCMVRVSSAADGTVADTSEEFTIWSGTVWHVDVNAAGAGTGESWANAFLHPQDAMDAASAGDEVWVAAGTYKRRDVGDTTLLTMKDGVAVYGGLAAGAASREGRDLTANETVLDGDADGDLVGDVYHVVRAASMVTLDGFTVTRGNANGASWDGNGGGLLTWDDDVVVARCKFSGNAAVNGGGVYNRSTRSRFGRCVFSGNSAVESGGGFCQESGDYGVEIESCTFSANTAGTTGGGVWVSGSMVVVNCALTGNSAGVSGGGMFAGSTGAQIANCTFTGNSADVGGGIFNGEGARPVIVNCVLWGDTATTAAPEIHDETNTSCPTVTYSCIAGGYAGRGNMDADPLFADAGAGDVRLQAGSTCIDAGDGDAAPGIDLDGQARHDDPGVIDSGRGAVTFTDVGAHEFQGTSTTRWLAVTAPFAGALCPVGSELEVVWRASSDFAAAKVELSRDGGGTWETLAGRTANDGCFSWTSTAGALALPQRGCIVKVSDADDPALTDTSGGFAVFSGVMYVDAGAPAGGDGLSWDLAMRHPQEALDAAQTGSEVRVAGGVYIAQGSGYTRVLATKAEVVLLGGHAGFGAADPDERDVSTYETVLDGEGARCVVVCQHDVTLDGFTVTRGQGGGMRNLSCAPLVRNCRFLANDAYSGGGMLNLTSSPAVIDCVFEGNTATYGGGMKSELPAPDGSPIFVTGCRFFANTATAGSGGIDNYRGTSLLVTNCLFWANDGANFGGGLHNSSASTAIANCTFFGNVAQRGGAVHNETLAGPGFVTITNCILWGDTATAGEPEIHTEPGSTTTVSYSCVEGGSVGQGNIGEDGVGHDPSFVDPDGADDVFGNGDDDLSLSASSPCIDTGDPATGLAEDLDGNPRPAGSGYDMGAYEQ